MSISSAGSPWIGSLRMLFDRQFVALCFVILLASTAYSTFYVYPTYLRALGMNERDMGLVMGAVYFGTLVSMPLTAKLMRRFGGRRIIALGLALLIITTLLLMGPTTLGWICALRFAQGVGWSAVLVASNVFATLVVRPERLAQGLTLYGAFFISGQSAGPLVAELATRASSAFAIFFVVSAAIGALALLGVPFLPRRERPSSTGAPRPQMRWLPTVLPLSATFLLTVPYSAATAFIADYGQGIGLARAATGFFSAFLLASLAARFGGGHLLDAFRRRIVIAFGAAVAAASCLCLSVLEVEWHLWAAGALLAVATSVFYPALQALLVERSADRIPAVTASVLVITLALTVGSAGGGAIADAAGYPALFAIMAGVALLGGALVHAPLFDPTAPRSTGPAAKPDAR